MGKVRSRSGNRSMSLFQSICGGKCHKPGILTRNPFLNFLRLFRKTHSGLTVVQVAVRGAHEWNRMPEEKKLPFVREACKAPKYKKKTKRLAGKGKKGRMGGKESKRSGRRKC